MAEINSFSAAVDLISSVKNILIIFPQGVNLDKVAAGLSLYLALTKMGKDVSLASPQPMRVEFSSLIGVDKVKTSLGGKNLVISFDYVENSIDKVSYNIDGDKFNLVIQPKEGFPPLAGNSVRFFNNGVRADLIVLMGVRGLVADLGDFYVKEKVAFEEIKTIFFGQTDPTANRGLALDLAGFSCLSEMVGKFVLELNVPVDEDLATNLMQGLDAGTVRFSVPATNAFTFELASRLLRAGGKRSQPAARDNFHRQIPSLKPMTKDVSASKAPEPAPTAEDSQSKNNYWTAPKIYQGEGKL